MSEYIALMYPTGELVGIDLSCGYPYPTDIFGMEKFKTVKHALDYMKHFKELKLVKVKLDVEITDIDTDFKLVIKLMESLASEQG